MLTLVILLPKLAFKFDKISSHVCLTGWAKVGVESSEVLALEDCCAAFAAMGYFFGEARQGELSFVAFAVTDVASVIFVFH